MKWRRARVRWMAAGAFLLAFALTLSMWSDIAAQIQYSRGQSVVPVFEGWQQNSDGSFDLLFGYFNRNWDEELDIPLGPDNVLEPGPADAGQPTHFQPHRNRLVFRVTIPKDFGKKEIVWTLKAHGKVEKAYGSLNPDYLLEKDNLMRMWNGTFGVAPEEKKNQPPVLKLEGAPIRTAPVGQPVLLGAVASDPDDMPKRRASPAVANNNSSAVGLRVAWFVYRGAGKVTFDPEQFKVYLDIRSNSPWTPGWLQPPVPKDGRFPVSATFSQPGTYVLRVMAHDGVLETHEDVTVTVTTSP